jgi:RimJ/RimL family protein N-acetyltransferase
VYIEAVFTPRLTIIPLTTDQLVMYLEREMDFYRLVGPASREILTDTLKRAIGMKLKRMAAAPRQDLLWLTYWLIKVPPDGFGAGMIGYKGAPDERGEVEIGYGIDSAYGNRGYMTEAVEGMIGWAFRDSRCNRILAPDTLRSNLASNRVLKKVGMRVYEEKEDSVSWCLDRDQKSVT